MKIGRSAVLSLVFIAVSVSLMMASEPVRQSAGLNRTGREYVRNSRAKSSAVSFGAGSYAGEKRTVTVKGVDYTFCWCPPGEFTIGSPESEENRMEGGRETQHRVELTHGFWLLESEVTQEMWKSVMGTSVQELQNRGDVLGCLVGTGSQNPIYCVTWEEAAMFCCYLGDLTGLPVTLPTEAEWEYACRAGTDTAVYTGDLKVLGQNNIPALDEIAWYSGNSSVDYDEAGGESDDWPERRYEGSPSGTHRVKGKKPNAWGLYDMIGNVAEWCSDWDTEDFNYPDSAFALDPVGPSNGYRHIFRGGSWYLDVGMCRAAARGSYEPTFGNYFIGFRPAIVPISNTPGEKGSNLSGGIGSGSYAGEKRVLKVNGVYYSLAWCPAGEFMMGSPETEEGRYDNEREHRVRLSRGFWMLTNEVTQEMWESVMGTTLGQQRVKARSSSQVPEGSSFPICFVNWEESSEFCRRLGALTGLAMTLPTEAQWEYACRIGINDEYSSWPEFTEGWGWYDKNADGRMRKVRMIKSSLWGIYDMHGNLWEWCSDWYDRDYYTQCPLTNPAGPSHGTKRIRQGGSWNSPAENCRTAVRSWADPSEQSDIMGFRFVVVPEQ